MPRDPPLPAGAHRLSRGSLLSRNGDSKQEARAGMRTRGDQWAALVAAEKARHCSRIFPRPSGPRPGACARPCARRHHAPSLHKTVRSDTSGPACAPVSPRSSASRRATAGGQASRSAECALDVPASMGVRSAARCCATNSAIAAAAALAEYGFTPRRAARLLGGPARSASAKAFSSGSRLPSAVALANGRARPAGSPGFPRRPRQHQSTHVAIPRLQLSPPSSHASLTTALSGSPPPRDTGSASSMFHSGNSVGLERRPASFLAARASREIAAFGRPPPRTRRRDRQITPLARTSWRRSQRRMPAGAALRLSPSSSVSRCLAPASIRPASSFDNRSPGLVPLALLVEQFACPPLPGLLPFPPPPFPSFYSHLRSVVLDLSTPTALRPPSLLFLS